MKILTLGWLFTVLAFVACNPTKRAYKGIAKYPPATNMDSGRLAARSLLTFPPDKSVDEIKIGDPIIIKAVDSTDYYKILLDFLQKRKDSSEQSIAIMYRDTCKDADDIFKEGFELGKDFGFTNCRARQRSADTIKRIDTLFRVSPAFQVEIGQTKIQLNNCTTENVMLTKKNANKAQWIWILVVACLVLLLLNILQFKR